MGLVMTFIGWGLVPALAKVLHSVWLYGGGSACASSSWSLKVLHFGHWSTHVAYAPNPGIYSIGFGFNHYPLA